MFSSLWGAKLPRLQLLTGADLLGGKGIDTPPQVNLTFKKASKGSAEASAPLELPL